MSEPLFMQELTDRLIDALQGAKGARLAYSVEEAGQLLGIGKSKAYDMVNKGELPSVSFAGSRRVTIGQILQFVKDCEAKERRKR